MNSDDDLLDRLGVRDLRREVLEEFEAAQQLGPPPVSEHSFVVAFRVRENRERRERFRDVDDLLRVARHRDAPRSPERDSRGRRSKPLRPADAASNGTGNIGAIARGSPGCRCAQCDRFCATVVSARWCCR